MKRLADYSYIVLKPETTEGQAVQPDIFLPLESSDLEAVLNLSPDRRMQGLDWETNDLSPGRRQQTGTIRVWLDPETAGYILDMAMNLTGTSGNASDGYTHSFEPGSIQSYTLEIPRGDYAARFFGIKADEINFVIEEDKLMADITVQGMGQFSSAALKNALSGTEGSFKLTQDYDNEPTRGLVSGDVLVIGAGTANEEEVTVDTVAADGITVNITGTIQNAHDAGVVIYLKRQDASISDLPKPFRFGGMIAGYGDDESAATSNAGSKSTGTKVQSFEMSYMNNLLADPTSQSRDPQIILPQAKACTVNITKLYEEPDQRTAWLNVDKQAITVIFTGKVINEGTPTHQQLIIKLYNSKLENNGNPLNIGEYIMDEQEFRAVYDSGDAKAISIDLINEKASY